MGNLIKGILLVIIIKVERRFPMNEATTLLAGSGPRILLTAVVIGAAIAVILLLMRSFRHWYGKTDEIIDSVRSMDERMETIESGLDSLKISTDRLGAQI